MENNQPTIEQLLKNMEKIAEAIMVARQAKAAAIFAASVDGFEELLKDS